MNKKILLLSTLALLSSSLLGCSNENTQPESSSHRAEKIVLNNSKVSLTVGEYFQIVVAYEDLNDSYETTYESSDESVVTVNEDGLVYALGEGEASVNVKKGSASSLCKFTVSLNNQVPYVTIQGIKDHLLEIDMTTEYALEPKVRFSNAFYDLEEVVYKINSNGGEGKMEGNVFVPTKTGSLNIEISGKFDGNELYPYSLNVNIKNSVVFYLKNGTEAKTYSEINLFTISEFKSNRYMTEFQPNVTVEVDGKEVTDGVSVELNSDDGSVNYDPTLNKITAIKMGKGTFTIKYGEYSKTIPVTVDYVTDEFEGEPFVVDASVGEFPLNEIFSSFPGHQNLVRATNENGEEYSVSGNKITGIKSHNFAEQKIILFNEYVGFVVPFKAYAKIIRTAQDLSEFVINFGTGTAAIEKVNEFQNDGYYILANDIDCEGVDYQAHTRVLGLGPNQISSSCGFIGTFDGQGYSISNMAGPKGGLFLVLGNGATVKNVAFRDAIINKFINEGFVLATYVYGATIRNVYINSSSAINNQDNAMVAACFTSTASIRDCVFEYTGNITALRNYGSLEVLINASSFNDTSYDNVYVISPSVLVFNHANKYYCDTAPIDGVDSGIRFVRVSSIKHYSTYEEMKDGGNDYSSFSSSYWEEKDGIISFIRK